MSFKLSEETEGINMDVTVLVAPAGCGSKPVKFLPKTHVVCIPEGVDAEDFMERYTERLVSQYHSKVYTWESVNPSSDLMAKFERYVASCEIERLSRRKNTAINNAYSALSRIYNNVYRINVVFDEFVGALRPVIPGMNGSVGKWVLENSYKDGVVCTMPDFIKIVDRAVIIGQKCA